MIGQSITKAVLTFITEYWRRFSAMPVEAEWRMDDRASALVDDAQTPWLKRFQAKWKPVRVKKTRQKIEANKKGGPAAALSAV
jgi:hypothetical protein